MAKTISPLDIHSLINDIVAQTTGEGALTATNTDDFVSVGEFGTPRQYENTLGAITQIIGEMIVATRPYSGKLRLIDASDEGPYTQLRRKISYYAKPSDPSGYWNTQLYTNLAEGFDNGTNPSGGVDQSTGSMWVQNPGMPLEMDFYSHNTWDDTLTRYLKQLKVAFRSEGDFVRFIDGILTEKSNDIEQQREAYRRMTLLSYMAGLYDVDSVGSTGQAINLTAAYNAKFNPGGTPTTTQALLTTNFKEFLEFLVSTIKQLSNLMTYRTVGHHWSVPKTVGGTTYHILRHTPKNRQKLFLYRPLLIDAQSRVFPEIFGPEFLNIDNYEGVDYWQSESSPMEINIQTSIPDIAGTNSGLQTTGSAVNLTHVIGVMFDQDAVWDSNIFEDSLTSPIEAKKGYYNTIWHINHGSYIDYTEKGILLYMAD